MGKRTRSQRRGSSPKNRVASHRFPAANSLPRVSEQMAEVVDLVHSPAHTAPGDITHTKHTDESLCMPG